ncbi:MAG: sugar ABC transporter permease [Candidatus ainarchaeum sp.]|nr:sugar ABC transporter permease [Candidatus ainarchaeum sp.]
MESKIAVNKKRNSYKTEILKNKDKYFLIAPFFILFALFTLIPVIASVPISFTQFNMLEFPKWVGWENFSRLFIDDEVFLIAVKNTIIFAFLTGPISYFACLFFAWLINDLKRGLRTAFTFVFYAPSISGTVFYIWQFIFSGDSYGFVNGFLMRFGIIKDPIQWLTDPKYNLTIVILVQLWLSLGAGFLAFIAGFQSIDGNLYEAGAIDGIRNRFQELIYITLPSMGPQLLFGAVMQIGSSFAAGGVAVALTGFPSTDNSTTTVVTHAMDYGTIRYEMGYAAALSFVLFLAMIFTNSIIRKILQRVASD